MRLSVRVEGLPEILSALRKAPQMAALEMEKGLKKMVARVRLFAQQNAPRDNEKFGNKPGLSKSISTSTKDMRGLVYSKLPYAYIREHGGVIRAKGGETYRSRGRLRTRGQKWLRFIAKGQWVHAKEVTQKGSGYLRRGLQQAASDLQRYTIETARRMAERLFRG